MEAAVGYGFLFFFAAAAETEAADVEAVYSVMVDVAATTITDAAVGYGFLFFSPAVADAATITGAANLIPPIGLTPTKPDGCFDNS